MDLAIYVEYDGDWVLDDDKWSYINGKNNFFYGPTDITHAQLLDKLYEILRVDKTVYDLRLEVAFSHRGARPVTLNCDRQIIQVVHVGKNILYVTPVLKVSSKVPYSCGEADNLVGSSYGSGNQTTPQSVDRIDRLPEEDAHEEDLTDSDHALPSPIHEPPPSPPLPGQSNVENSNGINPRFTNEDLHSYPESSAVVGTSFMFSVGKIFPNLEELKMKVAIFAMEKNFEFRVHKSEPKRWSVRCIEATCHWKLRANLIKKFAPMFKISVFVREHTCSREIRQTSHKKIAPRVVAHVLKDKFSTTDSKYTPKKLQEDMKKQFGIEIKYDKAWRCREKAIACAMGTPEDSFSKLSQYLYLLEQTNSGTMTDFQCEDGRFKHCFFAIGACLRGFKSVRPVVGVESTFIDSKYRGQLLSAVAVDGEGGLLPIAFAIVDGESSASWIYFLTKLKEAIGSVENLAFISDRHNTIARVLEAVFPNAYHGACYNRIKLNIVEKFKGDDCMLFVYNAAYAFRTSEFELQFNTLRAFFPRVAEYLEEIGFQKWARCHFGGKRYNIMTTNYVESLNNIIDVARRLPVTNMVEFIRFTIQSLFYDNRTKAEKYESTLVPSMENDLKENCDAAQRLTVHCVGPMEFRVIELEGSFKVNLTTRECGCGLFQEIGIPCVHAAAACLKCKISVYTLCSPFYSVSSLKSAYEGVIYPPGDESNWPLPDNLKNINVEVAVEKRSIGRPKKDSGRKSKTKRLPPEAGRVGFPKKCSKCGNLGHYRATCMFIG